MLACSQPGECIEVSNGAGLMRGKSTFEGGKPLLLQHDAVAYRLRLAPGIGVFVVAPNALQAASEPEPHSLADRDDVRSWEGAMMKGQSRKEGQGACKLVPRSPLVGVPLMSVLSPSSKDSHRTR